MEPISACYTTAYPEINPDSGYGSGENTENQAKTPPAPTYDEDLVHKLASSLALSMVLILMLQFLWSWSPSKLIHALDLHQHCPPSGVKLSA
ncbi:hypothetical protein XENOCAPTIV_010918 [Xenoophorus captivus]|uniref:Uncharacterized protein n=1 Tax=Xenoophorus captivus TaxID=1517983 RepID=A0ABV0SEK0_9TELE